MLNRFFHGGPLITGEVIELAGEELHHAVRVSRIRTGEKVEVFNTDGIVALGTVIAAERLRAAISIVQFVESTREAPLQITLAPALIQFEKFELVLQKATELGVSAFVPLLTERTEIRPERVDSKRERWERIVFEAVKQSGRSRAPEIKKPTEFKALLAARGNTIVFDAEEPRKTSQAVSPAITLIVGPEGGLSPGEIELARSAGCNFERLGPRRLRAETASIAAVTLIQARLGDMNEN